MKKIVMLFMLLIVSFAYSQEWEEGRNETNDPSTPTRENVEIEQTESSFYMSDQNVGVGTEMILSQNMKYFNLPINFRIKKIAGFTFQSYIPIIFSKTVGSESARGIGDITIGGAYWINNFLSLDGYLFKAAMSITLPTGNDTNTVNNISIPLGTGTYGFVGSAGINGNLFGGSMNTGIHYKINTPTETVIVNTWDNSKTTTNIRNGNSLTINGSFKHLLPVQNLYISGATQFDITGKGHVEIETKDSTGTIIPARSSEDDLSTENLFIWKLSTEVEYKFLQFGTMSSFLNSVYLKIRYPIIISNEFMDKEITFALGLRKYF